MPGENHSKHEKKLGRGNNLLMQDINAIFHETVKKEKVYYSYVHHFSDIKKYHKWANLILRLPKSHHWICTPQIEYNLGLKLL